MNYYPISRQPGEFQQPLTFDAVQAICSASLGTNASVVTVRELGSGLFNNTYLIELEVQEKFILRVAPQESTAVFNHEDQLLRREQALELPLRQAIGSLIPCTFHADFSRQLIERDFVLQTALPGVIWDEVKDELPTEANDALWVQLAEIARKIHRTNGPEFGFPAPFTRHNSNSAAVISIIEMMHDNLKALERDDAGIPTFLDLTRAGQPFLDQLEIPHLVHGDLWPKNVLIDIQQPLPIITGLLDAERGYWGDPLSEWIFYYLEIPASFWQKYGHPASDPATRFRQAVYRGQYAIQGLLEAIRFNWDTDPMHERFIELAGRMAGILQEAI